MEIINAVLVTGGAGFIGSAFVRYILERSSCDLHSEHVEKRHDDAEGHPHENGSRSSQGAEANSHGVHQSVRVSASARVIVLDRLSYCSTRNNIDSLLDAYNDRLTFIAGDVRDLKLVMDILKEHTVDCVVHFAGETHVDNSFENSLHFTSSNVVGTHTLLEACRLISRLSSNTSCSHAIVKRFLHVSTDEVYGETDTRQNADPSSEMDRMNPSTPYAATKAAAELIAQSYRKTFGLNLIITRCNNVYGPRQYPEKLVPKFILRSNLGSRMPIHGDGKQKRSYLYVDDVAEACWRLLERGVIGEVYNIGSDTEQTVLSVANDIMKAVARHGSRRIKDNGGIHDTRINLTSSDCTQDVIEFVQDRLCNDRRYYLDSKKILLLGWSPRTRWDDGLKKTVAWYLENDCDKYWEGCDLKTALSAHPSPAVSDLP